MTSSFFYFFSFLYVVKHIRMGYVVKQNIKLDKKNFQKRTKYII